MPPTPEWTQAHAGLSADIAKVAKKCGLPFRTNADLINTNARYPELVPVLLDWLKNVEAKSGLTDPVELHRFRSGLYRSLMTIDSMGTEVVPVLFDSFYLEPQAHPTVLAVIGDALKYLAVPTDYDRMRQIAADRSLSFGRAPVIEWLLQQNPDDALPFALGELDDPSVRPYILRALRGVKKLPGTLRPTVEQYLDDPDEEVRVQAKRTLAKIGR
ncbi:HEAT repeat domain-containing protein [Mycolicibacterium sp.]|uniref:HEAT repeat domain-containing protein n=1 Tax=Mycolicibacterium sp. TaxID=2320850 RepID=UPI0037CA6EE2